MEPYGLRLSRFQADAGEALELAFRRFHAPDVLAEIKLSDLVAFAISAIGNIDGYLNVAVSSRRRRLHRETVVAKGSVAESKSKGEEWLTIVIDTSALRKSDPLVLARSDQDQEQHLDQ